MVALRSRLFSTGVDVYIANTHRRYDLHGCIWPGDIANVIADEQCSTAPQSNFQARIDQKDSRDHCNFVWIDKFFWFFANALIA